MINIIQNFTIPIKCVIIYCIMVLCLFQGTFNPIHNAHLRVAQFALEHCAKDGILFIPAFAPPHKTIDDKMSFHRFNMVKLAIEDNKKFEISDIEFVRKGKSYTYLTVCELYENLHPDGKIKFIIGTDAFRKIETWYEANKLKELVDFLVFTRDKNFDEREFIQLKNKGYNYQLMSLPFKDISSTELRKRIKNGKSLTGLVPPKVEEYIIQNELYKN